MNDPVLLFSVAVLLFAAIIGITLILVGTRAADKLDSEAGHEARRLYVGAAFATGVGLLFLEGMAMYYWSATNSAGQSQSANAGEQIFEGCKTVLPPIVTLIIGFYFGRADRKVQSATEDTENPSAE